MGIKDERPTQRRMMSRFDRTFLQYLPLFKEGLEGNELRVLLEGILAMDLTRDGVNILDIGSADGDWLSKTAKMIRETFQLRTTNFTALEPVTDNPQLQRFCEENNVRWERNRIEESGLKERAFDAITSTHCAYYYYNQPLAHEEMWRLLKPGGILIVTLVSQACVLNRLTEELLRPHRQFTLNAESYLTMMSKLKLFTLRDVRSFKGRTLNVSLFTKSEQHLKAMCNVLARHRLPTDQIEKEMNRLADAVKRFGSTERLNHVMFFEKADSATVG